MKTGRDKPKLDRNPLERVRAFIHADDMARVHAIAESKNVTPNTIIRDAVKTYLDCKVNP